MRQCKLFKTYKERGEWVELRFMAEAMRHGLRVSKPWGDSAAYDVGVENEAGILRVQVKSTSCQVGNGYLCRLKPNPFTKPYDCAQVDFFAAYVIPQDAWYVIPAGVGLERSGDVMLCPVKDLLRDYKYEKYREAWELLTKCTNKKTL